MRWYKSWNPMKNHVKMELRIIKDTDRVLNKKRYSILLLYLGIFAQFVVFSVKFQLSYILF